MNDCSSRRSTEDDAIEIWAQRESARKKFLKKVSTEDRLEGIPTEKRLEGIPTEKRLEDVSAEDILKGLSPEQLAELTKLTAAQNKQTPENPGS